MTQQDKHSTAFENTRAILSANAVDVSGVLAKLENLQVAIPSWALGTGGTRFGRFAGGGEPANLEEKIADIAVLNQLTGICNSISLHIPWDIPQDAARINALLQANGLSIDSVNSNTFQDQPNQKHSYKFGSLCHTDASVRQQAIDHNIEVINHGIALSSKTLTVWLADGSNFPGQSDFRGAYLRTLDSLKEIYTAMPADWTMLIEYKPYEPNFYSMVIPDWGTSKALCDSIGENAKVLVDLGHHLPNTNIEQIVARLSQFKSLGGFHFNGSMYGDDDLTTGSIKPYQLFLIMNELVSANDDKHLQAALPSFMIDASHNTKDPLVDLMQSLENIAIAYCKALLVKRAALAEAQQENNVAAAEQVLQDAFLTDVRPLVAEARLKRGAVLNPVQHFVENNLRQGLIAERGASSKATGL